MRVGYNATLGRIKTNVPGVTIDRAFLGHIQVSATNAIASNASAVHASITASGSAVTNSTTAFTNPAVPRNITATVGGTATNIKATSVTITGTNYAGETITEILPAFTVDTAGTVEGVKAFKTVTGVSIPAQDGAGVTVTIGIGEKLGLPYKLTQNTVISTYIDNIIESTPATVTVSPTAIENNTVDTNTALSGKVVDIYLIV